MNSETPLIRPEFPPANELTEDYRAILERGRYSNFGPFEQEFCGAIGAYTSTRAVTFSSATTGLVTAVAALARRDRGDRIVMPSFTFAAVAQAALANGFKPLFVDIDPDTLAMDAGAARDIVASGDIAALVFCNPFGIGSDATLEWERLALAADLPLIIDSAAGFGSRYSDGTPLGARGTCEVFSFHATKPLAVGEGGAVTTVDESLARRLRMATNFGFDGGREAVAYGTNAKLAEIPSSIGLRQLGRLPEILRRRHEVFDDYREQLGAERFVAGLERSSLAFLPFVLRRGADRDAILSDLQSQGIEARTYYAPALHRHAAFAPVADVALPVTEDVEARMLSLPSHAAVSRDVVGAIVQTMERHNG